MTISPKNVSLLYIIACLSFYKYPPHPLAKKALSSIKAKPIKEIGKCIINPKRKSLKKYKDCANDIRNWVKNNRFP